MYFQKETTVNSALFSELENDYKITKEPEIENNMENDNENDSCNFGLIVPFINSLLDDNDIIIKDLHKKRITISSSKEKKSWKNKKHKNKKKKNINKLKNYNIRKGDWLCQFCNNLNFSFRIVCNKCGKGK